MESGAKRRADDDASPHDEKRQKVKKPWRTPRNQSHQGGQAPRVIQPGDSGIWATCNKGRERACVGELRDLFTEYAELLYGSGGPTIGSEEATKDAAEDDEVSGGIEDEINAEVAGLKQPVGAAQLFTPIRVDVQCVVFFKTAAPVEPVSFVQRICEDALNRSRHKRTRYAKRLSPMTLMGRASMEGLEKLAKAVLEPHFHLSPFQPRKFAIRPTLRNHNIVTRDKAIQLVAQCVGPGHEVDLKNYDLLIVVEFFQNVCGVSVLDNSFERLKRYNLAEIYDPTPIANDASKAIAAHETLAAAPKPDGGSMEVDATPMDSN